MRFLIDNALSQRLADQLRSAGHDVVHVRDLDLATARDQVIFDLALTERRTIITADTDFGTLAAIQGTATPSIIIFRGDTVRRSGAQAALLEANLPVIAQDIEAGAIVIVEAGRLRIRRLPIEP